MGTYGVGSFDTSEANIFVQRLVATDGHAFLRFSLEDLTIYAGKTDGVMDLPRCAAALAAAEVVAALRGRPSSYLPEPVTDWVGRQRAVNNDLVVLAAEAADIVRERGALREIWSAQEGLEFWLEAVDDLRGRLQ